MKMIRTLPTDKHGNVYYGPKTIAEARNLITQMDAPYERVVADLCEGGYKRIAAVIAKEFGPGPI